jgi:hypothetical protein
VQNASALEKLAAAHQRVLEAPHSQGICVASIMPTAGLCVVFANHSCAFRRTAGWALRGDVASVTRWSINASFPRQAVGSQWEARADCQGDCIEATAMGRKEGSEQGEEQFISNRHKGISSIRKKSTNLATQHQRPKMTRNA